MKAEHLLTVFGIYPGNEILEGLSDYHLVASSWWNAVNGSRQRASEVVVPETDQTHGAEGPEAPVGQPPAPARS